MIDSESTVDRRGGPDGAGRRTRETSNTGTYWWFPRVAIQGRLGAARNPREFGIDHLASAPLDGASRRRRFVAPSPGDRSRDRARARRGRPGRARPRAARAPGAAGVQLPVGLG